MDWISEHWQKLAVAAMIFGVGVAFAEDAKNVRQIPQIVEAVDGLTEIHEREAAIKKAQEEAKAEERAKLCAAARRHGIELEGCDA